MVGQMKIEISQWQNRWRKQILNRIHYNHLGFMKCVISEESVFGAKVGRKIRATDENLLSLSAVYVILRSNNKAAIYKYSPQLLFWSFL